MAIALQIVAIAGVLAAGWRSANRLLPDARSEERWVAATVLACSAMVVLVSVVGMAGMLGRASLGAGATFLTFLGFRWGRPPRRVDAGARVLPIPRPMVVAAAIALALALPYATRALWLAPVDWDGLTYHLYKPSLWLAEGRIGPTDGLYPLNYVGFYPANGEALITFFAGIAKSDVIAEFVNIPLMVAGAVASFAIAIRLGAGRILAVGATLLWITTPAHLGYAATSYVEPLLNFGLLACLLFILRGIRNPGLTDSLLAGLALGLAVGTKYSALYVAAIGGVAVTVIPPLMGWGWGSGLKRGAAFSTCAMVAGGTWYLLNAMETGNPFYPVPLGPFRGMIDPPFDFEGATQLTALPDLWKRGVIPFLWIGPPPAAGYGPMGLGLKLLLLAPIALLGALGSSRRALASLQRDLPAAMEHGATVALALTTLFTYLNIPYWHDSWYVVQLRVLVLPLALGAMMAASWARGRSVGAYRVGWLVATGIVLDAATLDLRLPGLSWIAGIGAVALATPLLYLGMRRPPKWRWAPAVALPLLVGVAWLADSKREESRFDTYATAVEVHGSKHALWTGSARVVDSLAAETVGVASSRSEFYYIFAGNMERRVFWVPNRRAPWDSWRFPMADPGAEPDRDAWATNLATLDVDVLVVARWMDAAWPVEAEWAADLGFERVFGDEYSQVWTLDTPGR